MHFLALLCLAGLVVLNFRLRRDVLYPPALYCTAWLVGLLALFTLADYGADLNLPPIHAPFTSISGSEETNTYTIYYSYVRDLGIVGVYNRHTYDAERLDWLTQLDARLEALAQQHR